MENGVMIVLKQKRIINKKYKVTHEKINLSQEDGIFHICFSDFRKIFNSFKFIEVIKYFNLLCWVKYQI